LMEVKHTPKPFLTFSATRFEAKA